MGRGKAEEIKNEAKKIYEDDKWLVVNPLTHKAACLYGANTQWCTSSKNNDSYFKDYTINDQKLYILIN